MRYWLFALALLAGISAVTVPTLSYADKGGMANGGSSPGNGNTGGGEGQTTQAPGHGHADPDCGAVGAGDEC
jgi:hypothetical protein